MVNLSGKSVLVTGGCGFIGRNFIEKILQSFQNVKVVNIDKMGIGSKSLKSDLDWKLIGHNNSYLELEIDLRDIASICWNPSYFKFDYIFHFAAESHVDRSIDGPQPFIENNVMAMVALLEWVRAEQPLARVINISTDEVYGHLQKNDPSFVELCPFKPRSPYSASKASADLIANSYHTTYGLDIVTTHCCNNFGRGQADEKFIPTVIRNMVQGKKIPVYGTGLNIREWIHVDDHNESLLEIAAMGLSGRRYNIFSGLEKTNIEMVFDIGKILDIIPDIEFIEDRKGHDFRYAISSLYYHRQFQLKDYDDALRDTVEYYAQQYEE